MNTRTVVLVGIGVVAVSISAPVMAAIAMPALVIAFWRNALTAGLIAVPVLGRRRGEVHALVRHGRRHVVLAVAAGASLGLHFGFWIASLTMTSVASSIAILSLQVVWVLLWEVAHGDRLTVGLLGGVGIAIAGAVVVGGVDLTLSPWALLGDLYALIGSVAIAAYTLLAARTRPHLSTTTYTFICYSAAAVGLSGAVAVSGASFTGYAVRDWALVVVVALTAQLLGHSVFIHLLGRLSPTVVSLALLLEIPGASIIAAAWLGQVPHRAAVVGVVLVLIGMVLVIVGRGPEPDGPPLRMGRMPSTGERSRP